MHQGIHLNGRSVRLWPERERRQAKHNKTIDSNEEQTKPQLQSDRYVTDRHRAWRSWTVWTAIDWWWTLNPNGAWQARIKYSEINLHVWNEIKQGKTGKYTLHYTTLHYSPNKYILGVKSEQLGKSGKRIAEWSCTVALCCGGGVRADAGEKSHQRWHRKKSWCPEWCDTSKQSKTKCHKANTNAKCTVGKCGTGNARYGRLITAGGSVRNSEEKTTAQLRNRKH